MKFGINNNKLVAIIAIVGCIVKYGGIAAYLYL